MSESREKDGLLHVREEAEGAGGGGDEEPVPGASASAARCQVSQCICLKLGMNEFCSLCPSFKGISCKAFVIRVAEVTRPRDRRSLLAQEPLR